MGILGDIIGAAAGSYLGSQYGQTNVGYTGRYPPYNGPINAQPAIGIPFYDLVPDAPSGNCGKQLFDPQANCGQGKWVKKSRRRRKRLATASDIKDLASLKSVLGGGKAFDSWIATRGR